VDPLARLRALAPEPRVAHGRPLFQGVAAAPWPRAPAGDDVATGLLWGLPDDDELDALIAALGEGATVACVTAIARGGARGALDRVLLLGSGLLGSRHTRALLEDVCTRLFLRGVGELRVHELEPRRNVVVVTGRRGPRAPST
jgi:hypothetical protein